MLSTCFMLASCLAYSSTIKMEVTCSSATSVDFQRTTRRSISEDRTRHNHSCENLKSCMLPLLGFSLSAPSDVRLGVMFAGMRTG
jgi:hypothetical protein